MIISLIGKQQQITTTINKQMSTNNNNKNNMMCGVHWLTLFLPVHSVYITQKTVTS